MKTFKDLSGMKFGELTVIERGEDIVNSKGYRIPTWLCMCNCGNLTVVRHYNLTNNKTKSCGCLVARRTKEVCKKKNKYDLSGEYGIGYTTNTNEEFYFDLEDYDKIKDYCWYSEKGRYLYCKIEGSHKNISMHNLLGFAGYDHIDRNGFNNRKSNFRICSQKENTRNRSIPSNNTSGFIGVRFHKKSGKWHAYILVDGKQNNLGYYTNKEDAVKARLVAENVFFKEFAPQKHLFKKYGIEELVLIERN